MYIDLPILIALVVGIISAIFLGVTALTICLPILPSPNSFFLVKSYSTGDFFNNPLNGTNSDPCACCGLGTSSSPYFAGEEEPPAAASMGTPMAPPLPGDIPGQPPASHKSLKNKKIRKTRR